MNLPPWIRWLLTGLLLLLVILVPFFLYEQEIGRSTEAFLASPGSRPLAAAVLGGLLASDIVLPVPSSLVSTASGYMLGFWAGTFVSWAGMTVGCCGGYWLGSRLGRGVTRKLAGDEEMQSVQRAERRYGDWVVVVFRAVPVLAEASVLLAGIAAMPWRRFLMLTSLSNLGIAVIYAFVGAYAVETQSFLLAFAGAVIVPAAAILLAPARRR
jgi:uncharacterized membrane protein YdjX (TVP38/TMEM64 family)